MDIGYVQKMFSDLQNSSVSSVTSNGGYLQIEINSGHLAVGCAWRLSSERWMVGNSSNNELLVEKTNEITRKKIISIDVSGEFHDLTIEFENGIFLETFADSSEYESWTLSFGFNRTYIGGPGRLWSIFSKDNPELR